jgi:hypothetical protein
MGALEAVADFGAGTGEKFERERAFFQAIGESFALKVFHHDVAHAVLFADIVELADVGMIQGRDGAGFAFETRVGFGFFGEMLGENFDGDGAVEASVARAVDFTHAACAEAGLNFVGAEFGAGGERHWVGGSITPREAGGGNARSEGAGPRPPGGPSGASKLWLGEAPCGVGICCSFVRLPICMVD